MQEQSDIQLLMEYAEGKREGAFRELVARHTDFVYSAALRQVNSPDLACDVAQSVFTDLARKARSVAEKAPEVNSLAGWLHRSTRYAALNHLRDTRRREANERLAMEQLIINSESAPDWDLIRPVLDEALDSLNDEDHAVLLLRYFEKKSLREVGEALGTSDDTAQKRVSRATERLREFFSKRKVAIGASGLAVALSANSVQAAPAGLAAAISTAALAGTAVTTLTAITATKTIAMTLLQKTVVTAALALVAGVAIYQAHQASQLREQNLALQQQLAPLADQIQQLQHERDQATNRLAGMAEELALAKKNPSDVLKLRGEVTALRQAKSDSDSQSAVSKLTADPATRKSLRETQKLGMTAIYAGLAKQLNLTTEQTGQLNDLLADHVMDSIDLITQALHDGKSRGEIDQMFASENAALQTKLQALVGPDGAAQYEDYTKNLGSTLTAAQFAQSMTGDPASVADKKAQLTQAIQAATQSALTAAGLPPDYQIVPMLNFGNIASPDEATQSLQLLDNIYGQVAANAGSYLSPDELAKFQTFRTNAINNSQTMLDMNRKLMAPIGQ
ncbi:MAG TPA: sigma-70 family RNA polymerase sigma factor [Verrucomicrobiae bacterium]|nr:sigma-70 family RNA polymerase sigma factor [Verrucomicrobiae bacterium]